MVFNRDLRGHFQTTLGKINKTAHGPMKYQVRNFIGVIVPSSYPLCHIKIIFYFNRRFSFPMGMS